MILYYILVLVIVLYLLFKLYIKITYSFWASQPVFHSYNLINWIRPSGIVNDTAKINKYCKIKKLNFINKKLRSISETPSRNSTGQALTRGQGACPVRGGGYGGIFYFAREKIPAILRDRQLDYLKANSHL